jgi:transposase
VGWARGKSQRAAARDLCVCAPTVMRAVRRYLAEGEAGLVDRRAENGRRKVDDDYLSALVRLLGDRASDHGWPRPTWTRELLVLTLRARTGTTVSPSTMSRALHEVGARRGRPRPTVLCPLSARQRRRRLAAIRDVLDGAGPDEVVVYEDEVDIHLNPKIGWDWMPRGLTREVVTPGKNRKAYLAGALDARDGHLLVVEGGRKSARLFIDLLEALRRRHAAARRIHVVLDNYKIHKGRQALAWLRDRGAQFRLHFLPPYCPDENRIERVWLDLHANVTRNHTRRTLTWLLNDVRRWIRRRNARAIAAARRAA